MSLKLWYSPASPFVRKVPVFAHEAGLARFHRAGSRRRGAPEDPHFWGR